MNISNHESHLWRVPKPSQLTRHEKGCQFANKYTHIDLTQCKSGETSFPRIPWQNTRARQQKAPFISKNLEHASSLLSDPPHSERGARRSSSRSQHATSLLRRTITKLKVKLSDVEPEWEQTLPGRGASCYAPSTNWLLGLFDFSLGRFCVSFVFFGLSPDVMKTGELGTRKLREADTLQM